MFSLIQFTTGITRTILYHIILILMPTPTVPLLMEVATPTRRTPHIPMRTFLLRPPPISLILTTTTTTTIIHRCHTLCPVLAQQVVQEEEALPLLLRVERRARRVTPRCRR